MGYSYIYSYSPDGAGPRASLRKPVQGGQLALGVIADPNAASPWRGGVGGVGTSGPRTASPGGGGS